MMNNVVEASEQAKPSESVATHSDAPSTSIGSPNDVDKNKNRQNLQVSDAAVAEEDNEKHQEEMEFSSKDAKGNGVADEQDEEELDVVVTAVEIENATLMSSLPVPYGAFGNAHGVVVELVVSSGGFSYRRQKPLSDLLAVLQHAVKWDDEELAGPSSTNEVVSTSVVATSEFVTTTTGGGEGEAATVDESKPPTDHLDKSVAATASATEAIAGKCIRRIPEFPSRSTRNDTLVAQWCSEMTAFLAAAKKQLNGSVDWLKLMQDDEFAKERNARMTSIDFVLQPFPYDKCYVARGSMHQVTIQVPKIHQFVLWKFELEDHDISFSVTFEAEDQQDDQDKEGQMEAQAQIQVHAATRYMATFGGRPVEGSYECPSTGKVCFTWDNSYSRIRGKNILYQVQVVDPNIMEAATAAADAFDVAVKKRQAKQKAPLDASSSSSATSETESAATLSGSSLLPTSLLQLNRSEIVSQAYQIIHIPETISQSWLVSAPMEAAGRIVSGIFGARTEATKESADIVGDGQHKIGEGKKEVRDEDEDQELLPTQREAKSLLEELNGLNMQLLTRNEALEDFIASLTVERDQARSQAHLIQLDKDKLRVERDTLVSDKEHLEAAVQRMQRDREAWVAVQAERDALLEEKHRWAAADDFEDEDDVRRSGSMTDHLDPATRKRLEEELDKAEANVVRLRVELGYSLTNQAPTASSAARLERITKEMVDAREAFEAKAKQAEEEILQLKQQNVKFRYQKRVLATELRNLKTEMEGQIAVAIAEASEARMVNRRLKKQNELLLTQMRTLVDSQKTMSADQAITTHGTIEGPVITSPAAELEVAAPKRPSVAAAASSQRSSPVKKPQEVQISPVPYRLTPEHVALLNGQPSTNTVRSNSRSSGTGTPGPFAGVPYIDTQDYRSRLVAFFQEKDPSMLDQVDEMLASYRGVESSLFESLELKYSFMQFQAENETG